MKELLLEVTHLNDDDRTSDEDIYPTIVLLQIGDTKISRVCVNKRFYGAQEVAIEALEEAIANSGAAQLALQAIVTFVWNEALFYNR